MGVDLHGPILIVDDNSDLCELIQFMLEDNGHQAVTAADGDEALELLRGGVTPCLILLDLMMPGKDGVAFRREQLADPTLADIPVIVYSAHFDVEAAAAEMHAVAHVHKSVDFPKLLEFVRRYCRPAAATA